MESTNRALAKVSYAELDVVTKYLLRVPIVPSERFTAPQLAEKMRRNELQRAERSLTTGLAGAGQVEKYLVHMEAMDPGYSEGLRAGFLTEYDRLRAVGLRGDSLFFALVTAVCPPNCSFELRAAVLSVLAYYFGLCEVFEP